MAEAKPVRLVELRVLDGPNLYFTRPAIKLTLAVPGWLDATEGRASAAEARIATGRSGPSGDTDGHRRPLRPGPARSEQRQRFAARAAGHLARAVAAGARTRLAVRARPGPGPDEVVVAYPWRHREAAEAFGREAADLFGLALTTRRPFVSAVQEAARRLEAAPSGPSPTVADPSIPVVAVTGTNGKTTTVRLLAHMARTAGLSVAYSSTDGVYRDGEVVEPGDYSGFGGAARALAQPGIDLAVLETARGGILLRGIGTLHNDVAVVTNVTADHLDLHGIRTLDQLAEVKATITHITRPDGWDVLNAEDPRVLAMRRRATGRPWLFSMDHEHPALREALDEGGRGMTVIDRALSVLTAGRDPRPLIGLEDVPVTLAGISTHNIQNAMGAAAAGLGIGLPEKAVVQGLGTFVLDPEANPGRTNVFDVEGRVVVIDYAHNEAGIRGLTEVCRGLRPPGGEVWLAFGTAGDRTNDIIHAQGYSAARGSDHVAVAEELRYLRGRDRHDAADRLRAGALDGGAAECPVFEDELTALAWMLQASRPGDVLAVTGLGQRDELLAMITDLGGRRTGPARIRQMVRRARRSLSGQAVRTPDRSSRR